MHASPRGAALAKLSLGALGVVYGDIGTSPLYALRECFSREHGLAATPENVYGIVSLFFWALMLSVSLKYLTFVMRADNNGEGGILALLALLTPKDPAAARKVGRVVLILAALFGASLLYGEGVITPAISVLSAVEGLDHATRGGLAKWVIPITVAILVGLFVMQKRGTAKVGAIFGPVMVVWFGTIAALGLPWIWGHPEIVLAAVNPLRGVAFLVEHPSAFLVLGSVVLCITGAEALYADMGHFGRTPIRLALWIAVLPSLLINYLGQGARVLALGPAAADDAFFGLAPEWFQFPMVAIATAATVVASQALISGAYSLTRQAMQLGYAPRMTLVHTSGTTEGQIYVPEVNTFLMVACVSLVFAFGSSTALAAAYGISVTGTMVITSVLFFDIMRRRWGTWPAGALAALFLSVELPFFAANLAKLEKGLGGLFPIITGIVLFTLMTTWKRGRRALGERIRSATLPLDLFVADLETNMPHRVKGTAVFMSSNLEGVPPVLLHHFKHNKVLHEQVILLSITTEAVPRVSRKKRVQVDELGHGFFRVVAHYGFVQSASVDDIPRRCAEAGLRTEEADTSYYLGRETLLTTGKSGISRWRKALFAFMSRNARPATAFFELPPNRVVEMGMQIEI